MAVMYGQPEFFAPRHVHDWFSPKKRISYYDTSALKARWSDWSTSNGSIKRKTFV
jgi:hypothetical protein